MSEMQRRKTLIVFESGSKTLGYEKLEKSHGKSLHLRS